MLKHIPIFMIKFLNKRRKILFLGALASLAVTFNACTDVDNMFGEDFIDPSQREGMDFETFAVDAFSVKSDSIVTGIPTIGSYNDPVMGQTNSSLVVQYVPTSIPEYKKYAKDINGRIDSLVLSLRFNGGIGDSTDLQQLTVFKTKTRLASSISYYSNFKIKDSIDAAISVNRDASNTSSAVSYKRGKNGTVRVKLSQSYINELFNKDIDTAKIKTYDDFISKFKCLYIENSKLATGGALNTMNLYDTASRVFVYFKVTGKVNKDSSVRMAFFVGGTPYDQNGSILRKLNIISHDYNGTSPYSPKSILETKSTDRSNPQDLIYLQGFGGLRTIIKFNDASVTSWLAKNTGAKIHRAELIIEPFFPNGEINYKNMPMSIGAYYKKKVSGKDVMILLPDHETFKKIPTNAFYNRSSRNYSINITTFFKDAMRGTSPREFYLHTGLPTSLTSGSSTGTNFFELPSDYINPSTQVILGKPGVKNSIKLKITYSK